jgi:hypothetical protein
MADRRTEFELAFDIFFGAKAVETEALARSTFLAVGVPLDRIQRAEAEVRTESIQYLKNQFPEFAEVIDERTGMVQ